MVIASLHHGLDRLPDELLITILGFCAPSWNGQQKYSVSSLRLIRMWNYPREREDLRKLCLVNKRFRDLIYKTSSFWNDFGPEANERKFARRLSMAGNTSMHFCVDDRSKEMILRHMHLCQGLRISASSPIPRDGEVEAVFPRVQRLALDFSFRDHSQGFFDTWKLPNLLELFVTHPFPSRIPTLTSLTVEHISDKNIGQFYALLHGAPSLQHLKFKCSFHCEDEPAQSRSAEGMTLSRLVTCVAVIGASVEVEDLERIKMWSYSEYSQSLNHRIANVADPLSNLFYAMPNVEGLEITLLAARVLPLDALIVRGIFRNQRNFTKLRDLAIDLQHSSYEENDINEFANGGLFCLVRRFPCLDSLTFSSGKFTGFTSGTAELARLKSFSLLNCTHIVEEQFKQFIARLLLQKAFRLENVIVDPAVRIHPYALTKQLWRNTGEGKHFVFS
jgi:hypothetical protein